MASEFTQFYMPAQGREEATPRRRARPPCYAAIDLGTNNCRMLIGVPSGGGFHVLDGFSRVVRLGEGLYRSGVLSEAAMDRAIEALQVCAERLKRWQVSEVRAIATEACRQAENGAEFVARARMVTGLPLETISPREEVGLAMESCAPLICQTGRRALLFDIGGGSTELAWVRIANEHSPLAERFPQLIGYYSIPVGVVTLTERCAGSCDSEAGFDRVVRDVAELLRPSRRAPDQPGNPPGRGAAGRHQRHGDDARRHRAEAGALPARPDRWCRPHP